jgi:lysophospholipase L1-like esterase
MRSAASSTGFLRHLRLSTAALLAGMAALVAVPADTTAATAATAAPTPLTYAALGDSYSSGVGTGKYDVAGPPCERSSLAFPALWAQLHPRSSFTFVACAGAWISQVGVQQVSKIPRNADLVTVTMGGNDIGFSPVLATCALARLDGVCTAAVDAAKALAVTEVPLELALTLSAIEIRAPHARIVVLGYPRLFELGSCPAGLPDAARRKAINGGTDLLIGVLTHAAALFHARFVDIRPRFAGHGLCAPNGQSWINGPDAGGDRYHPTWAGQQQGLLPALISVTG